MTEHSDPIEQPGLPGQPSSTLSMEAVGRLLVEAREKMGLSVDEVGTRLRLTPKQVLAMESGHIEALPGAAFVRGFLRNYAKLLQIDAEPLLEACRAHGVETTPKQISLHSENIQIAGRERKGLSIYLATIVVVILALAAWFAYMDFSGENMPAEAPVDATIPQELPGETVIPQPIEPLPQAPVPETLPLPAQPATPGVAPAATPEAAASAPVASATLVLAPKQTSWVGVTDRDGKEIFSRNVLSGSSETITGTPPLKVVVGNAAGMAITYNGNPVDIAPHIRSNVARLTLE